jgi:hypothetical protein
MNNNTSIHKTHEAITKTDTIPSCKEQANILIEHYSDISHLPLHKDKHIVRHQDNFPLNIAFALFTTTQTTDTIKHIKNSTAEGRDQIYDIHLKQLGAQGILVLTNIANNSMQHINPTIWKKVKL